MQQLCKFETANAKYGKLTRYKFQFDVVFYLP